MTTKRYKAVKAGYGFATLVYSDYKQAWIIYNERTDKAKQYKTFDSALKAFHRIPDKDYIDSYYPA